MRRRLVLVFMVMGVALLLSAAVAMAAIRVGTSGNDTLNGTAKSDLFDGKGGNDTLNGLAGNDTYSFTSDFLGFFNNHLLTDSAGTLDALSFANYVYDDTNSTLTLDLESIPEWNHQKTDYNFHNWAYSDYHPATGEHVDSEWIEMGTDTVPATVEKFVGVSFGTNVIATGGAINELRPGAEDSYNSFVDLGGYPFGNADHPKPKASSDVYKGFTGYSGTTVIEDWGGTRDKLDLAGVDTSEVYFFADNLLSGDAVGKESLVLATYEGEIIVVLGYFDKVPAGLDSSGVQQYFVGAIENLQFADGSISPTKAKALVEQSASSTDKRGEAIKRALEEAPEPKLFAGPDEDGPDNKHEEE